MTEPMPYEMKWYLGHWWHWVPDRGWERMEGYGK